MDIVRECAEAWDRLITGKTDPGEVSMYVDILYVFLYFADLISFFFLAKTQLFNTHQPVLTLASYPRSHAARILLLSQLTQALTSGSSSQVLHQHSLVIDV